MALGFELHEVDPERLQAEFEAWSTLEFDEQAQVIDLEGIMSAYPGLVSLADRILHQYDRAPIVQPAVGKALSAFIFSLIRYAESPEQVI